MASSGVDTGGRLVGLAWNLANSQLGLTKDVIRRRLRDYAQADTATFDRTFERDIATLRRAGLRVEVIDSPPGVRYRLTAQPPGDIPVELSPLEADLLSIAAQSWDGIGDANGAALVARLSVITETALNSPVEARLEGRGAVGTIFHALQVRQPISFAYASRTGISERDVVPWRLLARGRALYLWGFDLNRWDQRMFRLARIVGNVSLIGEPGEDGPPIGLTPPEVFTVQPTLKVREGRAPHVMDKCLRQLGRKDGWITLEGQSDAAGLWERLILESPCDVIVLQPEGLRRAILASLEAAVGTQ